MHYSRRPKLRAPLAGVKAGPGLLQPHLPRERPEPRIPSDPCSSGHTFRYDNQCERAVDTSERSCPRDFRE